MIMPSLLLQKPSRNSKSKENNESLTRRLQLWKNGVLISLLKEDETVQSKLSSSDSKSDDELPKRFSKLMMNGKISAALRLLDEENSGGVLPLTPDNLSKLKEKHPAA